MAALYMYAADLGDALGLTGDYWGLRPELMVNAGRCIVIGIPQSTKEYAIEPTKDVRVQLDGIQQLVRSHPEFNNWDNDKSVPFYHPFSGSSKLWTKFRERLLAFVGI